MKLFFFRPIIWSSFLVLWAPEGGRTVCSPSTATDENNQDICQNGDALDTLFVESSLSVDREDLEKTDVNETFTCLLYPTNLLNCSWSFLEDSQLSVCISVCDGRTTVDSRSHSSEERVGSSSLIVKKHENLYVTTQFNMSLHGAWKAYTYKYNLYMIEVPSPPPNVSATVNDGNLLVTWDAPRNIIPWCLEYQLDLGDQEEPKEIDELSYTEVSDPSRTYMVRVRARRNELCATSAPWGEWSPTVTVEQLTYELNTLLIISISLGIPMILLAVLLLVCHQRLSELLFPPIPCPPPKYIYFLEKNDTFSFFHPAPPPKDEEEITKVEDAE